MLHAWIEPMFAGSVLAIKVAGDNVDDALLIKKFGATIVSLSLITENAQAIPVLVEREPPKNSA